MPQELKIKEADELLILKIKRFKTILILFALMALAVSITRFYAQAYSQFFVDIALIQIVSLQYQLYRKAYLI